MPEHLVNGLRQEGGSSYWGGKLSGLESFRLMARRALVKDNSVRMEILLEGGLMEEPADRVVNGSEPVELLKHSVRLSAPEDYVGTARRAFDSSHLRMSRNTLMHNVIGEPSESGVYEDPAEASICRRDCYAVTWSVLGGASTPQEFQTLLSESRSRLTRNIAA